MPEARAFCADAFMSATASAAVLDHDDGLSFRDLARDLPRDSACFSCRLRLKVFLVPKCARPYIVWAPVP